MATWSSGSCKRSGRSTLAVVGLLALFCGAIEAQLSDVSGVGRGGLHLRLFCGNRQEVPLKNLDSSSSSSSSFSSISLRFST